ncbi:hypothetical protein B0H17DRAFT_1274512 [Mycena rosella]|uniref:DUF6534 domain-containing protein n=1 Tax=Mycena rosella TaxID=1033263 RepID=A0AAD7FYV9_MYCRO|nr:hypothetical protein B0H17DRAFT_1274512 [Mycena rosella]
MCATNNKPLETDETAPPAMPHTIRPYLLKAFRNFIRENPCSLCHDLTYSWGPIAEGLQARAHHTNRAATYCVFGVVTDNTQPGLESFYILNAPSRPTDRSFRHELRSFLKLDETKPITTLKAAASLACDVLITAYLCIFLTSQKGEMMRTNSMMDTLMYAAINRGILTAMSSFVTMVLFLVLPDTFWFFLGLAPSSNFYMNSMLATLNTRQRIRDKMAAIDKGWNSIPLAAVATNNDNPHMIQGQASIAAVNFETPSVGNCSIVATCSSKAFLKVRVDMHNKRSDYPLIVRKGK